MTELEQMLELYEYMEKNKDEYLSFKENFINKTNLHIKNHDLNGLKTLYNEMSNFTHAKKRLKLGFSECFKIESILNALQQENEHKIVLFWNDVNDFFELIDKYNTTIFMIRRLDSELPETIKKEAHDYLSYISPFIVKAAVNDPTVIIGKPDFTYITLAMDRLQEGNYMYTLLYLRSVSNQNEETQSLISKLEVAQNNSENMV